MTQALVAISPGPYVTIQDTGRLGWRRFGIATAGAMDIASLIFANSLVGNPTDVAGLEFAHVGGAWEVATDSCRIAVTGGDFSLSVDGQKLPNWQSHSLRRGQRFMIGGAPDAVWGYLGVAGGFDIPPRFGSLATHLRSRLGGLEGGLIKPGDVLPLAAETTPALPDRRVSPPVRPNWPFRIVLGPQQDYFDSASIETFLRTPYKVTHRADRMGTWLDGPRIAHARGFNVVSDGIVPGCIQVPGAGIPIVLLKDCQTHGGYPKLATIITADLSRFAQLKPGTTLRFTCIGVDAAQAIAVKYHARLAGIEHWVEDVAEGPQPPTPTERMHRQD
jgi:5-oxoprolinase (ATP-hydrolysing) subunit C